ncbi:MAG: hypothetical protein H0U18_17770 [Pyrinomonadaceae bacterium]|nr:hypothetical protein [Pyrinomonadaceae bacterium]
MPELNLNYAQLPEWLAPKQDLPTFGQFLQARQVAMQQTEQNLMLPIKAKLHDQEFQMNALKTADYLKQRDDLLQAETVLHEVSGELAQMFESGKPMEAVKFLLSKGAQYPILPKSPQYQSMMKGAQTAVTLKQAEDRISDMDLYRQDVINERRAASLDRVRSAMDTNLTRELIALSKETPGTKPRVVTRDEFISRHVGNYTRQSGLTFEQSTAALGNLYDKEMGDRVGPTSESPPVEDEDTRDTRKVIKSLIRLKALGETRAEVNGKTVKPKWSGNVLADSIDDLISKYSKLLPESEPKAAKKDESIPRISTQEEWSRLPIGAPYIGPDGKKAFRK